MKTTQLILLLTLFMSLPMKAQRCLPGMSGIRFNAGMVDGFNLESDKLAYYTGLTYDRYLKNGNRWTVGVEYLQKNYPYLCGWIPANSFVAEVGYFHNIYSDRSKNLFISLGVSPMLGYELGNWNKKLLCDGASLKSGNTFIYGGAISCEVERYITDEWILFAQIRERIIFGSTIGKFHFQYGIGVKYMIKQLWIR